MKRLFAFLLGLLLLPLVVVVYGIVDEYRKGR